MRTEGLVYFRCWWFLVVTGFLCSNANAGVWIRGTVKESGSGQVIPYANVYYPAVRSGVIADLKGNFSLQVNAETDTLIFTAVGFKRLAIRADAVQQDVFMQHDAKEMQVVLIRPGNDRYYFHCLDSCRKYPVVYKGKTKAVFHQASKVDEQVVEQMDAYYNVQCNGYDLGELQLKTGRFGLKPHNGNFFISFENTKAITLLPLLSKPGYFPMQPLCMSVNQMEKHYLADEQQSYLNESGERMLRLKCIPRDTSGAFFTAEYTLNRSRGFIEEVRLTGHTASHHPFVPFTGDSIVYIHWNIYKSFSLQQDTLCFRQVNFSYATGYHRLRPSQPNTVFQATTTAILYAYDHHRSFQLPVFDFSSTGFNDYQKINAFGYNDYFWSGHREYRLADQEQALGFYLDPAVVLSKHAFLPAAFGKTGLFEFPFVHWSRHRIRIRQTVSDTIHSYKPGTTDRELYDLSVKILAELDTIEDKHHLRTAVVMDPYQSYWRLPEDSLTLPFVNIYFDFCEIQRRKLEEKYRLRTDAAVVNEIRQDFDDWLKRFSEPYFRDVQRGRNLVALEKCAAEAERELVIRNLYLPPADLPEEE